ncbi:hypothetical protein BYT27DRAFT_7228908 [Phlegmacium glaucopus]|nr:hypothetical protein BYT27DRAFT_7228908 [Phlegmacium glaucopus]
MGKSKGKKRTANEAAIATPIQDVDLLDGWMQSLLSLGPDLAYVLASLAHAGQISASQIKKARLGLVLLGLPSFSYAKWSELAPTFNLPVDLTMTKFDSFSIDPVLLPPSFHETTTKMAWHIQDVYQELVSQEREEVRVRVFDAYIIPIVGLFQGRIIDKPEHPMMPTAYSSRGEVKHELFMIGGILFFVVEMKLAYQGKDNVAQLFLELLSAAEMNKNAQYESLHVHGLLTDLQTFHFYSYDQSQRKFAFDETLHVSTTREMFMADMIHVTNKVFTVVLFAYVEGLAASVKASHERPPESPVNWFGGSSPAQQLLCNCTDDNVSQKETSCAHDTDGCTRSGPCKSTEQWELALDFARQCLNKFQEPVCTIEDIEKQSCEAIRLLTKSVHFIPHVSHYSGKEDPSTKNELRVLTHHIVCTEYMTMVEASTSSAKASAMN